MVVVGYSGCEGKRKGLVSEFKCNAEGRKINACMLLFALDA